MIRFVLENVSDDAILTVIPSVQRDLDHPIDNVKKIGRTKFLRTIDADTTVTINGALTESASISALVIARHNFSRKIAYRIKLYDSGTNEVHDSGLTQVSYKDAATALYEWGFFDWGAVPWNGDAKDFDNREWYDLVWWADEPIQDVKYFTIELSIAQFLYCNDTSITCNDATIDCNTDLFPSGTLTDPGIPYFEIGRLYMGIYEEPAYTISPNHTIEWAENTQQYRTSSGTLRSDYTTTNRRFNFSLKTIPEADRADLHKKLIEKGKRKDFYISMFYNDPLWDKDVDYSGLVKFTKIPKYTEFIPNYYKANFTVEEI